MCCKHAQPPQNSELHTLILQCQFTIFCALIICFCGEKQFQDFKIVCKQFLQGTYVYGNWVIFLYIQFQELDLYINVFPMKLQMLVNLAPWQNSSTSLNFFQTPVSMNKWFPEIGQGTRLPSNHTSQSVECRYNNHEWVNCGLLWTDVSESDHQHEKKQCLANYVG